MLPDFRGVWAGEGTHCRWPDEFMLIYGRDQAEFPFRSALEPDRRCRILSVQRGQRTWRLRLSCDHPDPAYRLPKPFEVHQVLRPSAQGDRITVETSAALGQPARVEQAFYCREMDEGPPTLRCMTPDGQVIDCPP
jgi:hypothetical protein